MIDSRGAYAVRRNFFFSVLGKRSRGSKVSGRVSLLEGN